MTSHLQQFSRLTLSGVMTAVAHVPFGLYVHSFNLLLPTKFSTKYGNLLCHCFHTRETSAVAFTSQSKQFPKTSNIRHDSLCTT